MDILSNTINLICKLCDRKPTLLHNGLYSCSYCFFHLLIFCAKLGRLFLTSKKKCNIFFYTDRISIQNIHSTNKTYTNNTHVNKNAIGQAD